VRWPNDTLSRDSQSAVTDAKQRPGF